MYKTKTYFDSQLKIWNGPRNEIQSIFNPNASVGEILMYMLQRNPDKISQISASNDFKYTNSEIRTLSIRAAQNLQNYGIKQLDVIGFVASNSENLAPLVFGASLIGAPINATDTSFNKNEIKHTFGITKPKIIFCDKNKYEDVYQIVEELELNCEIFLMKETIDGVKTVEEFLKKTDEDENFFFIPKLIDGGKQIHTILCSSGTTGLSKGVSVSHEMLLRHSITNLTGEDITLCFSTLYWFTGIMTLLISTISGATRIIYDKIFDADVFFKLVETYNITTVLLSPSNAAEIVQSPSIEKKKLFSIKKFICGGSFLPSIITEKIENYLTNGHLLGAYGMSETGFCSMETNTAKKTGSAGQLLPYIEVKIIDELNRNQDKTEVGEILIRTPTHWKGYYDNKQATDDAYDEDGWVHSGDLGYFDKDGYLFIIDRKKDCIKYKGYQFFPSEIETILLELDDVLEVSVCGIYSESIASLIPAAGIVKKPFSNLTENEIYEYASLRTSDYKKLRGGIYFFSSLPKTPSGKIQKRMVMENITKQFNECLAKCGT